MNIEHFIQSCIERKISFTLQSDDQLKVHAVPGGLTPDVMEKLREHKAEIITWLTSVEEQSYTTPP
ncbi:hypothetical protein, partial [Pseudoalteromonas sp. MMG007]|uniref:TubC N-terminal docking domain-related protein n=1 Tax=Pseudoalteromonas sp. MMG007 TaxID=2822684 RepID=UPI001B364615